MKAPRYDRPWVYLGVDVWPADRNSSGIRWYARVGKGHTLRSDTKDGMRQLIREAKERARAKT